MALPILYAHCAGIVLPVCAGLDPADRAPDRKPAPNHPAELHDWKLYVSLLKVKQAYGCLGAPGQGVSSYRISSPVPPSPGGRGMPLSTFS